MRSMDTLALHMSADHAAELAHGPGEHRVIGDEGDELARGHLPLHG